MHALIQQEYCETNCFNPLLGMMEKLKGRNGHLAIAANHYWRYRLSKGS